METTSALLNRVTNIMMIIKESYVTCQNKVQAPLNDTNGWYLVSAAEKYKNNTVNNVMKFIKMQLFWTALPHELRSVVAQKDHATITLEVMYNVATSQQRKVEQL
jgi:hypothetical protein